MRGRVPRVEVDLSQDSAASATFVALRFTSRSQADRPSEIKSVRKSLRDSFVFIPIEPDKGQTITQNTYAPAYERTGGTVTARVTKTSPADDATRQNRR